MSSRTTWMVVGLAAAAGLAYYFFFRKTKKHHKHHEESYQRTTASMVGQGVYVTDQVDYAYRPEEWPHYLANPGDKKVPLEMTPYTDVYEDAKIADGYVRMPGTAGMEDGNRTRRVLLQNGDYGTWRELTGIPADGVAPGANVEAAYAYDDGHPILYQ